jgi:hypothetical protein
MRVTTLLQTSFQLKSAHKVMGLQSHRSPNFETSTWESQEENDIWVLALWSCIENTIRGKVVASPSPGCGESYESMFVHGSSMHQKCSNFALTNLVFGLCRFV